MLFVLLAVSLVASALGHKCCGPSSYTAKMFVQQATIYNGQPKMEVGVYDYAYDRSRQVDIVENPGKWKLSFDFVTGMMTFANLEANTCDSFFFEKIDRGCIPDDAVKIGKWVKATGSLATAYSFTMGGAAVFSEVSDFCIPIVGTNYDMNGTNTAGARYQLNSMGNVKLGISNASIFEMPITCNKNIQATNPAGQCCSTGPYEIDLMQEVATNFNGTIYDTLMQVTVSADYEQGVEASVIPSLDMRVVTDLTNKVEYFITQKETVCTSRPKPLLSPRGCAIPNSAVKVMDFTITSGQTTSLYNFDQDGRNMTLQVVMPECQVLSATNYNFDSTVGDTSHMVQTFGLPRRGISNPDVLKIPDICKPKASANVPGIGK